MILRLKLDEKRIIAVIYKDTTFAVVKINPEKKIRLSKVNYRECKCKKSLANTKRST